MGDMTEIHRALGRIEGKLDGFDERFERLDNVEKRVGSLEGWRKWMMGAQAAVLAVFAVFIRLIK